MIGTTRVMVGDPDNETYRLKKRIDHLEELVLRGKKIRPNASGSSTGTGSGSTGLTQTDVLNILVNAYIAEEPTTTTGTSHTFDYAPAIDNDGNPVAFLDLNGVVMRLGSTGTNGWTFTAPNTITTVRSLSANDKLLKRYIKRTL